MALNDLQRAFRADIRARDDPRLKWDEPWEQHGPGELMHGGPPLRETGERWPHPTNLFLHETAKFFGYEHATWLTSEEIAKHGGVVTTPAAPRVVMWRGQPTPVRNVSEISGLPARFYGPFWEIKPANPDPRDSNFDRYTASLDITIEHTVEGDDDTPEAVYRGDLGIIRMPPFELFFSARDYYHALAHELTHWADHVTKLAGDPLKSRDDDDARRELIAEFGAVFLCADMGLVTTPSDRTVAYIRYWRAERAISDAATFAAAEAASRVATWLRHSAPGWRAPKKGEGQQADRGSTTPSRTHRTAPPEALAEAASARRFVAEALALESTIGGKDRDAWDRKAAHLLEQARHIDLDRPRVVAAIEAAVALETPLGVSPPSATAWLEDIRARMTRVLDMRRLTKDAQEETDVSTRGPRFSP